ncbi:DUF896 domain-containing protein [Cuneatibacter caecimuris]|uniref:UPF0291 protein EV209_2693 n=1 Tax=Cuneatibacter caecimuris TaxID=1796618 RepID=A0A4Q7P0X7_9FIRM|nr:uncharacterized protein YnzC (UPF0291/DUF896 family) [Cuneatibacter caecimuris]
MIDQKTIDRINELYHKKQAQGLTPEEEAEQAHLRGAYIRAFRENLRGSLETIKIQNPDGTIIDVKKRHDEKMEREAENGEKRDPELDAEAAGEAFCTGENKEG